MNHSSNGNHWRQMFDNGRRTGPSAQQPHRRGDAAPFGYDDGYDSEHEAGPARRPAPLSPEDITDEAAMALALNATEYRPWTLQRGRGRPALMLHLRRFEPRSGLWMGWQVAYSHLVAVEYVGETMLSIDFGSRQFVIEGNGLDEVARHLQSGNVLMVQEFSSTLWNAAETSQVIDKITNI